MRIDRLDNKYTLKEKVEILVKIFFNQQNFKDYLNTIDVLDEKIINKINSYFSIEHKSYLMSLRIERLELAKKLFFKDVERLDTYIKSRSKI